MPQAPKAEALVVVEQRLGELEEVRMAVSLPIEVPHGDAAAFHQCAEGVVERGFIQASLQPRTRVPNLIQRLDVPGILQAREELDLTKLDGLKTAGRRQL